jgi:hypothetical protein
MQPMPHAQTVLSNIIQAPSSRCGWLAVIHTEIHKAVYPGAYLVKT